MIVLDSTTPHGVCTIEGVPSFADADGFDANVCSSARPTTPPIDAVATLLTDAEGDTGAETSDAQEATTDASGGQDGADGGDALDDAMDSAGDALDDVRLDTTIDASADTTAVDAPGGS